MTDTTLLLLLPLVGLIAGIINTIAGGGSLLTLPFLIFMGLPPAVANGTNRIGILLQSTTSIVGFKSKGITPSFFGLYLGISALIGAIIGAEIAIDIKGELFNRILAAVMILIVAIMILKPKVEEKKYLERTQGKYRWLSILIFFFIGIYGGFIQAGVGMLILLALNTINHTSLVRANAIKAIVVCIYTVAALSIFIFEKQINLFYGFLLALGNAAGGWLASRWSVKKGEGLIKIFLIIMVITMAIKLWFGK